MKVALVCVREVNGCGWSPHKYKHFPAAKMTPKYTVRPNPARYLPGFDEKSVQTIEGITAADAFRRQYLPAGKAEYLRDVDDVIGWDDGHDATFSYVECSGGAEAGRVYHGRPMHSANRKLKDLTAQNGADEEHS